MEDKSKTQLPTEEKKEKKMTEHERQREHESEHEREHRELAEKPRSLVGREAPPFEAEALLPDGATGRISPARPTSPITAQPGPMSRLRWEEAMATHSARSAAGSSSVMPPAMLIYTS